MSRELNSIDRILHCICRGPKFELKLSKWTAQPISDWPERASDFIGPLARLLKKNDCNRNDNFTKIQIKWW
jgi:hypothetical protein